MEKLPMIWSENTEFCHKYRKGRAAVVEGCKIVFGLR